MHFSLRGIPSIYGGASVVQAAEAYISTLWRRVALVTLLFLVLMSYGRLSWLRGYLSFFERDLDIGMSVTT